MEILSILLIVICYILVFIISVVNLWRLSFGKLFFWINVAAYAIYGIILPLYLFIYWNNHPQIEAGLAGFAFIIFLTLIVPGIHWPGVMLFSQLACYIQRRKGKIPYKSLKIPYTLLGGILVIIGSMYLIELKNEAEVKAFNRKQWKKKVSQREANRNREEKPKIQFTYQSQIKAMVLAGDTIPPDNWLTDTVFFSELVKRGAAWCFKDSVYTGVAAERTADLSVNSYRSYYKGIPHGTWIIMKDERGDHVTMQYFLGQQIQLQHRFPNGKLKLHYTYDHDGKPHGNWKLYSKEGQPREEKFYVHGVLDSVSTVWYENGNIRTRHHYFMGKPHGKCVTYYDNGLKKIEMHYNMGNKTGKWTYWNEDGEVLKTEDHD